MTSATSNKGFINNAKSAIGGKLKFLLSLPDKPKNPTARKAARVAADLVVMSIGITLLSVGTSGFDPTAISNPSLNTLMAMPPAVAALGVGGSWLLQDLLSKEIHRTVGKVLAVVMPLALFAGAACLIASGFHSGFTLHSMNSYYFGGLLLVPLTFLAAGYAIHKCGEKEAVFVRRAIPPTDYELDNFASDQSDGSRRIDESQRHNAEERFNHNLDEAMTESDVPLIEDNL